MVADLTAADMPLGTWIATAGLTLVAALPFAFYGLAVGLLFRSDAAIGAASGVLVVFAFLGNVFMPLGGVLLDIGKFTQQYATEPKVSAACCHIAVWIITQKRPHPLYKGRGLRVATLFNSLIRLHSP